tara:strand:+ start:2173 stop:2589 length:417 start_codon:yes stop_codon:yes gene_type:complete
MIIITRIIICTKFIETLIPCNFAKFFFEISSPDSCKSLSLFIFGTRYCLEIIEPKKIRSNNIVDVNSFSINEKIKATKDSIAVVKKYDGNKTLNNLPAFSLSRVLCILTAIIAEKKSITERVATLKINIIANSLFTLY